MQIVKTILEVVFIVLPFLGSIVLWMWHALKEEKKRNEKYCDTLDTIRLTCDRALIWLDQNIVR